jgi:hypothetical protein
MWRMNEMFIDSLEKLDNYVRDKQFKGIDPYDVLNAPRIKQIHNRWLKILFTQFFVYSPVNFRPFFQIKEEVNPKGIGLFLRAYCQMYKTGLIEKDDFKKISSELVEVLFSHRSTGYSDYCWGFNFDWQDITRYAPAGTPTLVVSSYVGQGFLDLYDITKEKKYLNVAESICKFILRDLHVSAFDDTLCFSYTPIDTHVVHNANCLGAAFLSRVYSFTHDDELLSFATKAFNFTVSHQRDDGSWTYQLHQEKVNVRNQIDFHQGFIVESLYDFIRYSKPKNNMYFDSLRRGAEFYKTHQFFPDGSSKYRLPLRWPVDIHNQAQGIITFAKLCELNPSYHQFAQTIARWTIANMQQKKSGYFTYQKWPFLTNKTPYMRWAQAWMMLALATVVERIKKDDLGEQ